MVFVGNGLRTIPVNDAEVVHYLQNGTLFDVPFEGVRVLGREVHPYETNITEMTRWSLPMSRTKMLSKTSIGRSRLK